MDFAEAHLTGSGQADGSDKAASDSAKVSIDEAAAILETSGRNVRRYIAEGKLPAFKSGRGRVIPIQAVQNFKAERDKPSFQSVGQPGASSSNPSNLTAEMRAADTERENLLAHLQGEVDFLRARNAELNAVVMQQARALASASEQRPAIEAAPIMPQESPKQSPRPQVPPEVQTAPKRAPRPLWALILGIRSKP